MAPSQSCVSSAPASTAEARSSPVPTNDDDGAAPELRRGPWTVEEDLALVNYITGHGEGRWNSLAQAAGLKRTGKSCRLRWLNYLRPDVKRGNFTADEQLLILDLHSRYGNRWSKIAQHLPGRTDNEIKNYWRTRVQKHAKQLNCDANSKRFKDAMRYLWMPHLVDVNDHRRILLHAAAKQHQQAAGGGMGVPSASSSDSFATSDSSFPKKWESSSSAANEGGLYGEIPVNGGGEWPVQEMNQAAGMFWPDQEQMTMKAEHAGANNNGGQQFEDTELSGWVQSFSEGLTENFWTLEDIWKMQL